MQQLKKIGLGNKPKEAEILDDSTLNKMYDSKTLGTSNQRALFALNISECRNLCWEDVQLCLDEADGTEYLIYDKERQTKTRTGAKLRDSSYLYRYKLLFHSF